jgi:hypothetical protein
MVNRHQQDVIEYLKEENKVLREKIGGKRILLRVTSYRNRGGCGFTVYPCVARSGSSVAWNVLA